MEPLFPELRRTPLLHLEFVHAPLADVLAALDRRPAGARFSYVITPNADHLVRLRRDGRAVAHLYAEAGALLLDSRVVGALARWLGLPVPDVVPGSELTFALFDHVIRVGEPITVIGTTKAAVAALVRRRGLSAVAHFAPPFGFERDPAMVAACADFVESHPARFIFLAAGAPRQELVANLVARRGTATGIGLCIGSALDLVAGMRRPAPAWMRERALEWAWRLAQEPRRLARRYLRDDPAVLMLLIDEARRQHRAARP